MPLGLLLGTRCPEQKSCSVDTPENAARAAFDLLKSGSAETFVANLDAAGVARFRATLLPLLDEAARAGDEAEIVAHFGLETIHQVRRLAPGEFLAAYWRGALRALAGLRELLEQMELRIVGHVREDRETAHVVARMRFHGADGEMPKPAVVTFQETEAGWSLVMGEELEGMRELQRSLPEGEMMPRILRTTHRVLGHIADGPGVACVVCRMTMACEGGSLSKVWALPVPSDDPCWAMLSSGDREGLERLVNEQYGIGWSTLLADDADDED